MDYPSDSLQSENGLRSIFTLEAEQQNYLASVIYKHFNISLIEYYYIMRVVYIVCTNER